MTKRGVIVSSALAAIGLTLTACGSDPAGDATSADSVADAIAAAVKPKAGEYRTTGELVRLDIPGMSDAEVQQTRGFMQTVFTQSNTFCLTPEEAEKGFEEVVRKMRSDKLTKECSYDNFDVSGNTVNAMMKCDDGKGNSGTITLEGTVSEDSQQTVMTMEQSSPDLPQGKMTMEVKSTSTRIGECPA